MDINNFYLWVVAQILAKLAQENIHTPAVEIIVVMPDFKQCLFAGEYVIFLDAQQPEQLSFLGRQFLLLFVITDLLSHIVKMIFTYLKPIRQLLFGLPFT